MNLILTEMVKNPAYQTTFVNIFGKQVLKLEYLQAKLKFHRGNWKSYDYQQVIQLRKKDPIRAENEVQRIIAQFPHEFPHKDRLAKLKQVENCLKNMGYTPIHIHRVISDLEDQLVLSFNIWKAIMLKGKILALAQEGISR